MPEFLEFLEIQQNKYKFVYIFVFASWVIKVRPEGMLFSPSPYKTGLMHQKKFPKLTFLNVLQAKKTLRKKPITIFRGAVAILLLKKIKLSATIFLLSMASILIHKKLKLASPFYIKHRFKPQNFAVTIVSVPWRLPKRLICGTDL